MQYITPSRTIRQRTHLLLFIIVLVSLVAGVVSAYENGNFDWRGLLGNLSTELIGGVITFVLIDQFITRTEDEISKRKTLISQLENHDSGIVKRTMQELRALGWLQDGSLYGWFLQKANFEGLDLRDVNMNGLGLFRCNLKHARLSDEQCLQLNDLRFTIMPDGSLYDGRFCLSGDVAWAKSHYGIDFMDTSIREMADYYGVSEAEFLAGQRWAFENLVKLGYETPPYLQKLAREQNFAYGA